MFFSKTKYVRGSDDRHPQSTSSNVIEKTTRPNIISAVSDSKDDAESSSDSNLENNRKDRPSSEQCEEHLTGVKLYTLFLALVFVVLMIALDAAIISTAIPRITDDFHTIANVGWYGSAYMIANSSLQPLTGKVYTFYSLKFSFFAFVALFELGSIICATATSSMMLVIGRAVAGMGGAGLANGSLTLIGIAAPPSQRPTIMGVIMSMFAIGQLTGPLVGGALTQHASWRWCFWINLPVGAATVLGILAIRLPPQEQPKITRKNFLQNFDLIGFLLFAPASIMLLLALQWGGIEYSWSSATIIGLFAGSGVIYIIFIFWERHQGSNAMFPATLLRQHIISFSILTSFLFGGSLLVLAYYLPLWFQVIKHASPTTSAVNSLPLFIAQILASIISGPLSTKIGFFSPFSCVGAAISSIGTGLMSTLTPTAATARWIGYQILCGAGRGLAFQAPINAVQAALNKSQLSTGMAIVIWSQFFGGAVFLALGQTAFASLLKSALLRFAPDIDPAIVINAGATNYQNVIPPQSQPEVLLAYNQAITKTFYLPAATAAAATLTALGMGWKRVVGKSKTKKDVEAKADNVEAP